VTAVQGPWIWPLAVTFTPAFDPVCLMMCGLAAQITCYVRHNWTEKIKDESKSQGQQQELQGPEGTEGHCPGQQVKFGVARDTAC